MEPRFGYHDAGAVRLHFGALGDPAKPLAICLHGFPEYWAAWSEVAIRLADDFHVVLPDQRGFNLSSRPAAVEAYRVRHMVADLASLAERFSPHRPFVLAGHDWGASVAYAYAFAHPQRVSRLVIANGVHPVCFQRAIVEDEDQRRASQYINRLRAADAETLLAQDGYRRLMRMIEGFSAVSFMTEAKRAAYLSAWQQPGALTGMLNWYRASRIAVPAPEEEAPIAPILDMAEEAFRVTMPHLLLWGETDQALRPACTEDLARFAPGLTVERFAGVGHWILHERPDEVAAAIRNFTSRKDV